MQAAVEDLDFSPERGLERRLILELSQCNWVDQALNILVSGATGTGKSFVACSLDTAAICLGYSVRYFRTARFLLTLTRACQEGSYLNLLRSLSRTDVLIPDDWMRDPIPLSAAQDLLEVFDDRFGKSATIIDAQVPVSAWHARFPDPTLANALLDRTVHNAYQLPLLGDSQRKLRAARTLSHLGCPHEHIVELLGKSGRFRIHDDLFWNSLWNCTGTAKNPRQVVEKWKCSSVHFSTTTTNTSPQNQSYSLRSACCTHAGSQLLLFRTRSALHHSRVLLWTLP